MDYNTELHKWSYGYLELIEQDYQCYLDKKNFFKDFCNQFELTSFKNYLKQIILYKTNKMRQDSIVKKFKRMFLNSIKEDETFDSIEISRVEKRMIQITSTCTSSHYIYYQVSVKFQRFEFKVDISEHNSNLVWKNCVV